MGNLRSLAFFALLSSLTLVVSADTSNDAAHAKDEVNDAIEPQQRRPGYCRYGCCGSYAYGQCSACCTRPQTESDTNNVVLDPQQRYTGGCRHGCCGSSGSGRCKCCPQPQTMKTLEDNTVEPQQRGAQAEAEVVEPQQRGGCRYGCCGSSAHGQCSACCSKKIAKSKEEAKP